MGFMPMTEDFRKAVETAWTEVTKPPAITKRLKDNDIRWYVTTDKEFPPLDGKSLSGAMAAVLRQLITNARHDQKVALTARVLKGGGMGGLGWCR